VLHGDSGSSDAIVELAKGCDIPDSHEPLLQRDGACPSSAPHAAINATTPSRSASAEDAVLTHLPPRSTPGAREQIVHDPEVFEGSHLG
jgi:ribonuclease BN (tRNA processing enzyme)